MTNNPSGSMRDASDPPAGPQTISWNLTRLCNLGCDHCYLEAGTRQGRRRDELDSETCLEIVDQIAAAAPECLLILTGGEPLLRRDLETICDYATQAGLWVVVGTNGTLLTTRRAKSLLAAGAKGVGISLDSLQPEAHDRFRGKEGAWREAVAGLRVARDNGLDSVVQMSIFPWNEGELEAMAEFAEDQGARALNVYFLVCTGRGQTQTGLDAEATEAVYARLHKLQQHHAGRMLINAKCAPQFQRFIHHANPDSEHLHTFETGCPAGTHYARIGPTGIMTPCPYMPEEGESLVHATLEDIWRKGGDFLRIRERASLGGHCGLCAFRQVCGGCRARALATHGDLLGEDPCCTHRPRVKEQPIQLPGTSLYGMAQDAAPSEGDDPALHGVKIEWDDDALAQMGKIPPFVRGMVKRRMDQFARKEGKARVTAEMLAAAKEKASTFLARRGKEASMSATIHSPLLPRLVIPRYKWTKKFPHHTKPFSGENAMGTHTSKSVVSKSVASKIRGFIQGVITTPASAHVLGQERLGVIYQNAIGVYEKTLATHLEKLGAMHPGTANDYTNLGEALVSLGQYQKAIKSFEKALAIYSELYPEDHPDVRATEQKLLDVNNRQQC